MPARGPVYPGAAGGGGRPGQGVFRHTSVFPEQRETTGGQEFGCALGVFDSGGTKPSPGESRSKGCNGVYGFSLPQKGGIREAKLGAGTGDRENERRARAPASSAVGGDPGADGGLDDHGLQQAEAHHEVQWDGRLQVVPVQPQVAQVWHVLQLRGEVVEGD